MKEEILKSPPYIQTIKIIHFLITHLCSNIGIYSEENLGDIHFFSESTKEIFESIGFKVRKKIYKIQEPESFPVGDHIPEPEIFPINNEIPHITPHLIDKPIPNFIYLLIKILKLLLLKHQVKFIRE